MSLPDSRNGAQSHGGLGTPGPATTGGTAGAGTQGGNGQAGGGHWETCCEKAAVLWGCLGIPLPRAEKVQLLQGGTRCEENSQKFQVKVFRVRNCQVRVKCFSCNPAAKRS